MKRSFVLILCLLASAALFYVFIRSRPKPGKIGKYVEIAGVTALGSKISIDVTVYDPPLLVTGNRIDGNTNEEWLAILAKLKGTYLLTYGQFKDLVTPEFLRTTGYISEEKFSADMKRFSEVLRTREPIKSSILHAAKLKCMNGEFLVITEFLGKHLVNNTIDAADDLTVMMLFRRVDDKWKQESPSIMKDLGLDWIPWTDRNSLLALSKCTRASVINGVLRPQ
jgi:hypothetical protein